MFAVEAHLNQLVVSGWIRENIDRHIPSVIVHYCVRNVSLPTHAVHYECQTIPHSSQLQLKHLNDLIHQKYQHHCTPHHRPVVFDILNPEELMNITTALHLIRTVNQFTKCGFDYVFWVNDMCANNTEQIHEYIDFYQHAFRAMAMDMSNVYFKLSSKETQKNPNKFWMITMNINRAFTINRLKRCTGDVQRAYDNDLRIVELLKISMNCAAFFYLSCSICCICGDDKTSSLIWEIHKKSKDNKSIVILLPNHPNILLRHAVRTENRTVCISIAHMSDNWFVKRTIRRAYCPVSQKRNNGILQFVEACVFVISHQFMIVRKEQHGGDIVYNGYDELQKDYESGALHPVDLKNNIIDFLNNNIMDPFQEHFRTNPTAQKAVKKFKKCLIDSQNTCNYVRS
eukprot:275253_1